jgi:hypothetical protein
MALGVRGVPIGVVGPAFGGLAVPFDPESRTLSMFPAGSTRRVAKRAGSVVGLGRRVRLRGASVISAGLERYRLGSVPSVGGFSLGGSHRPHIYSLEVMGFPSCVKVGIG